MFSGKIKHFSGTILHCASNETEAYLEPSQTSMIFAKIVNGYKWLTVFTKKLHLRCSTWF